MHLINKLLNIIKEKVNQYGAQYYTFAIFGLINYPLAYLYELYNQGSLEGLWLRAIAAFLCLILLFKEKWPKSLKKFLPLYWYITIMVSLPILAVYTLLIENFSLIWLINFNIGIMVVVLLLDFVSFLFITGIGTVLGTAIFYLSGHSFTQLELPEDNEIILFLYMFLHMVVLGSIFTRNREIFNHYIQKNKDALNESLEIKVKKRTIDLQNALNAKTEFLNNMSHEMRTPILGFTNISEGLVEHWQILSEEKKIKYANDIAESAKRLGSLISNILDLSTFSANKMYINFTKTDLNTIIETSVKEASLLYSDNKKIKVDYSPIKEAYIKADPEWINQVFRHLFSNAVKFIPNTGSINISLNQENKNWHLIFSDDGIGIPENEINHIFEPFTQSSLTKTGAGGKGLGLAICREIIEAHGGQIWATNNKDSKGSSFHIKLPSAI